MTRHLLLAAHFPVHSDRLYDAYLDPQHHAAITGQPVTIDARPGSKFSAFGGVLTGTMLHVEPKRLIVQTWRSANWSATEGDSILALTFHADGEGARIELAHTHIPDSDFAGICNGWETRYFAPWRKYLESQA